MTQPHASNLTASGTKIPVKIKLLHRANFVMTRASFLTDLARHVPAVFTVLAAGASALQSGHEGSELALAVAELVVGAWVLVVVTREAWHMFGRHTAHAFAHPTAEPAVHAERKVDTAALAAAALGYVESWHRTHVTGHFKLWSPQIVGATVSLMLAFGGRRMQKRKLQRELFIAVTPDGMQYKAGPRTSWHAAWTDIAAVEHSADEIAVRLQNGRRRVLRADTFFEGEDVLASTRAAMAVYAPAHLAR